jgi:apolipoprotein N-acyltransferase
VSLEPGALFASFFVSLVGLALFRYGRKQSRPPQLGVGVVLMVFPYFVSSPLWVGVVATTLLVGLGVAVKLGL